MRLVYHAEVVNNDPVACAHYFDKLLRVIMNILQSRKASPFSLYRVVDYFNWIEFQHRGSAPVYTLLWLEDAPTEDLSDYMPATTAVADFLVSPDACLFRREHCQLHQHTRTCYKRDPTNTPGCRLGARFCPTNETRVLTPALNTEINLSDVADVAALNIQFGEMHGSFDTVQYRSIRDCWSHSGIVYEAHYLNFLKACIRCPTTFLRRHVREK